MTTQNNGQNVEIENELDLLEDDEEEFVESILQNKEKIGKSTHQGIF